MQTTFSLFAAGSLLFAGTAVAAHYQHGTGGSPLQPAHSPDPDVAPDPARPFQRSVTTANVQLQLTCDRTTLLASDGLARMQVRIASLDDVVASERRACDVIVVLDRSGSMGGEKMTWAKRALHELVGELRGDDRFSLLSFSSGMQTHIGLDADNRATWAGIIDDITPGGGTNMGAALQPALALAEQSRAAGRDARVIVLSDGEVNEGLDGSSLLGETKRAVTGEFVVSAVGIGSGFNEAFMQQLSDAGTGNYHYIKQAGHLGEIFVNEFEAARQQVARALRVVFDLPAGVTITEAAGYPVDRHGNQASIALGSLQAGRERSFWLTLRAEPGQAETISLPTASLHFVRDELPHSLAIADRPLLSVTHDQATALAGLDRQAWAAGVVDEAYNGLKEQVAKAVREGDQAQAKQLIADYQQRYIAANAAVQDEAVAQTIEETAAMEREVDAGFAAPAGAQAVFRNAYSKDQHASSFGSRRGGSRK